MFRLSLKGQSWLEPSHTCARVLVCGCEREEAMKCTRARGTERVAGGLASSSLTERWRGLSGHLCGRGFPLLPPTDTAPKLSTFYRSLYLHGTVNSSVIDSSGKRVLLSMGRISSTQMTGTSPSYVLGSEHLLTKKPEDGNRATLVFLNITGLFNFHFLQMGDNMPMTG